MGTQRKKNIETIENDIPGSDYQGMEQFVSASPWDSRALMDDVAKDANRSIGDPKNAGLYIDETSFQKKGKASVGVQRQWSGRMGKVENCQVGVFASLGNADEFALIDFALYLPQSWVDNPVWCEKAKIPKEQRVYASKWEQALELVRHARKNDIEFGWVGADGLYGNNQQFVNALEDDGEFFMADIHSNLRLWLIEPELCESTRKKRTSESGASALKLKSNVDKSQRQRADKIVKERFESSAKEVSFRAGTKGQMSGRFMTLKVWLWDDGADTSARQRTLLVREDEGGDMKYSLTNLPDQTTLQRLAYIQGQRYWIEHAFHEAKKELGMAQYQVRVWKGWHHHMALVCLATVFMMKEKRCRKKDMPLLSCRDIVELLDYYLPRRSQIEGEIHVQIKKRHAARQRDIDRRRSKKTGIARRTPI